MLSILFLSLISINVAYALVQNAYSVHSSGAIKIESNAEISLFSDFQCTQPLTAIDWGNLPRGVLVERTVYVKNLGTEVITLCVNTSSWEPVNATDYFTFNWAYDGNILGVYGGFPMIDTNNLRPWVGNTYTSVHSTMPYKTLLSPFVSLRLWLTLNEYPASFQNFSFDIIVASTEVQP